jgi:uncharacterized NAD-dependent epimerase/dehydratase family protein
MASASAATATPAREHPGGVTHLLPSPYLLFLGDTVEVGFAKTAFGLRDWAGDRCVGEFALPAANVSTGLPFLTPDQAYAKGARALVIGVANQGGIIPGSWVGSLVSSLEAGLDIISGMHAKLSDIPQLAELAGRLGRRLIDVRTPPEGIPVANGKRRAGKRLLTVGTDCALGKKYTALALTRGLRDRGVDATFRATGQTGILIAGEGIPIDAVVADFIAGAAEMLSPAAAPDHVDVIEGQGSLLHPSYAGVTLGLLHGSQPDLFVVCHDPARTTILGYPDYPVPSIEQVIEQTIALGRVTNHDIRCVGISLNTSALDDADAQTEIEATERRLQLPTADPVRGGPAFDRLVEACAS